MCKAGSSPPLFFILIFDTKVFYMMQPQLVSNCDPPASVPASQ